MLPCNFNTKDKQHAKGAVQCESCNLSRNALPHKFHEYLATAKIVARTVAESRTRFYLKSATVRATCLATILAVARYVTPFNVFRATCVATHCETGCTGETWHSVTAPYKLP